MNRTYAFLINENEKPGLISNSKNSKIRLRFVNVTSIVRHLIQKRNYRTKQDLPILRISFHQVTNCKLIHDNLFSRFELNFRRGWKTCTLLQIYIDFTTTWKEQI